MDRARDLFRELRKAGAPPRERWSSALSLSLSLSLSHTHSLTLFLFLSLSHSHTYTHTHTCALLSCARLDCRPVLSAVDSSRTIDSGSSETLQVRIRIRLRAIVQLAYNSHSRQRKDQLPWRLSTCAAFCPQWKCRGPPVNTRRVLSLR